MERTEVTRYASFPGMVVVGFTVTYTDGQRVYREVAVPCTEQCDPAEVVTTAWSQLGDMTTPPAPPPNGILGDWSPPVVEVQGQMTQAAVPVLVPADTDLPNDF